MRSLLTASVAIASLSFAHPALADCDHMTRPIAARIAAALRPAAPAWARPLVAPAQLVRFDATNYHPTTFFLGYSVVTIERLGVGGAAPFQATVAVRCRDQHAELVTDPYAWANARARELHVQIGTAEQAAGYAAEIVSMSTGHRPDGASASRHSGVYQAEISLAPRQGETGAPRMLHLVVEHDGSISQSSAAPAAP